MQFHYESNICTHNMSFLPALFPLHFNVGWCVFVFSYVTFRAPAVLLNNLQSRVTSAGASLIKKRKRKKENEMSCYDLSTVIAHRGGSTPLIARTWIVSAPSRPACSKGERWDLPALRKNNFHGMRGGETWRGRLHCTDFIRHSIRLIVPLAWMLTAHSNLFDTQFWMKLKLATCHQRNLRPVFGKTQLILVEGDQSGAFFFFFFLLLLGLTRKHVKTQKFSSAREILQMMCRYCPILSPL